MGTGWPELYEHSSFALQDLYLNRGVVEYHNAFIVYEILSWEAGVKPGRQEACLAFDASTSPRVTPLATQPTQQPPTASPDPASPQRCPATRGSHAGATIPMQPDRGRINKIG